MYLTAHQVRSSSGEEGVNAFLGMHRDQALPLGRPDEPDIDYVAQLAGGYPVAEQRALRPGNNTVTAYLDLVAPDAVREVDLGSAVSRIRSRIGSERTPITELGGGVAARFGAVLAMDERHDDLRRLLERLWVAAAALLARRYDPAPAVSGPLVVWAASVADGVRLWLPPATLSRLPRSPARRVRILVPHEVMQDGTPMGVLREAAVALLGIGDSGSPNDAGVEIVDPRTAKTLARYDLGRGRGPRQGSL